ncbi:MAG: chorismate mutase [Methanobacteriota archaeon]
MELELIRKEIDRVDTEILGALGRRFELALLACRAKEKVEDHEREAEVLRSVRAKSIGLLRPDFTGALYAMILEESKALQRSDRPRMDK